MSESNEATETAAPEAVNEQILNYAKAGYPLLWLVTHEESRAERDIIGVAQALANEASPNGRQLYAWSYTEGLVKYTWEESEEGKKLTHKSIGKTLDPVAALNEMKNQTTTETVEGDKICMGDIFIMRDLHRFTDKAAVVRHLRDCARDYKQKRKTVIVLAPTRQIPPDLERDAVVVDFELPTEGQIKVVWDAMYNNSIKPLMDKVGSDTKKDVSIDPTENDRIIQAARGLTSGEAENAFAMAATSHLRAVRDAAVAKKGEEVRIPSISSIVLKEKANAVRKTGILEYMEPNETMANIGGLENLKKWIEIREKAFSKGAREFGLPFPRGIALSGLPGCGKSLAAKAIAAMLGIPLIRFDVSRVFGGRVGQSEEQMRTTLQLINRVGNCVVWIDEAEKALAGMGGSGSGDSGTTKRVFGNLLTWMQEREPGAFMVMTMNDINVVIDVAPELIRKGGRVDEVFFVGLPNETEAREIFDIHIRKFKRDPEELGIDINKIAANLEHGFSGAEIQGAVEEAMFLAFHEGKELSTEHIMKACKGIRPLAVSQKDVLDKMVKWASENAVNASKVTAAKSKKGTPVIQAGRDLDV